MFYVYAICDPDPVGTLHVHGIGDEPLHLDASDGIGAIYTKTREGAVRPTADNLWRHEQVIERVMNERTVLPARFGTVVADRSALRDLLRLNRDRLAAGLERVRGCVELGVRVLAHAKAEAPRPPTSGATGRSYLLARMEQERARRRTEAEATELATRLHDGLRAFAKDASLRVLPTPQFLLTGAYLVQQDRTEGFRRCVVDASARQPTLGLLCTGPWPPYHFVPELALPAVQHA